MTNFFLCDIGLDMKWKFWKRPVQNIIDIGLTEDLSKRITKVQEISDIHSGDLATINTAINRIERKQNRWLDVLNLKDPISEKGSDGSGDLGALKAGVDYPAPAAQVAEPGTPGPGDEIPDYIPGAGK